MTTTEAPMNRSHGKSSIAVPPIDPGIMQTVQDASNAACIPEPETSLIRWMLFLFPAFDRANWLPKVQEYGRGHGEAAQSCGRTTIPLVVYEETTQSGRAARMRYVILWSVLLLAGYASAASPPAGDQPESSAAAEGSKSDVPATEGGTRLTVREIDIFRRQIGKCWMPPLNAPNTEELVVDVRIEVSRARTVKRVTVVDWARMKTDSYFHAMAASTVSVFRHPDCSHLRLPPEKYETWKEITLHFDPSKMVGRK